MQSSRCPPAKFSLVALALGTGCFSDAEVVEPADTEVAETASPSSSEEGTSSSDSTVGADTGAAETTGGAADTSTDADDATNGDASTSGAASTGGPESQNLLINGSFEMWGGGAPVAWNSTAGISLEMVADDPYEGSSAARIVANEYGELRQSVNAGMDLPSGTIVVVELAFRWIEGATTPPGIDLYGLRDGSDPVLIPAIVTPAVSETWVVGGGNVTTEEVFTGLQIAINAGGGGAQILELDDARMYLLE